MTCIVDRKQAFFLTFDVNNILNKENVLFQLELAS